MHRRVSTLLTELETLQKERSKVQGQDVSQYQDKVVVVVAVAAAIATLTVRAAVSASQVNQIWGMMQRWDDAVQQLPAIIARLQSLKDLHEESAAAVLRMQAIDAEHSQVVAVLSADKSSLAKALTAAVAAAMCECELCVRVRRSSKVCPRTCA